MSSQLWVLPPAGSSRLSSWPRSLPAAAGRLTSGWAGGKRRGCGPGAPHGAGPSRPVSPPPPNRRRRLAAGSLRRLPRDSPGGCAGRRRPEVICAVPGAPCPREEELGSPGLPGEVSASRTLTRCCAGQLSASGTQRHSPSDAKRSLSNRVVICEENITGCCSWAMQHSQRCPAGCLCCCCAFSRWIR